MLRWSFPAPERHSRRVTGDRDLIDTMERWLGLSPFAVEERQVA